MMLMDKGRGRETRYSAVSRWIMTPGQKEGKVKQGRTGM